MHGRLYFMTPQPDPESPSEENPINPTLKLTLEMGPIILFVLSYNFGDRLISFFNLSDPFTKPIFLATAVIMVATLIAIAISWSVTRTLPAMPIVTAVVVSIFGGLTLYLQDDTFIKLKPTIINTLFGVTLISGMLMGKSFLKTVMGQAFQLDQEGWNKLTWRWGFFFLALAVVNEIVWRNFSEGFWVGFKFWGMTGLTMAFVASQLPMMMKHSTEPDED
ncbi:MAG: septation protein A [Rhizobiaceae bacterium]|nr:septation protein A [Rhizobiaceae bacterium]